MMPIFMAALQRYGAWVMTALSIVASVFFALRSARSVGKAEANSDAAKAEMKRNEEIAVRQIDSAREAAKTEVQTVKVANDVQANVNRLDAGDAADKLFDKWARD